MPRRRKAVWTTCSFCRGYQIEDAGGWASRCWRYWYAFAFKKSDTGDLFRYLTKACSIARHMSGYFRFRSGTADCKVARQGRFASVAWHSLSTMIFFNSSFHCALEPRRPTRLLALSFQVIASRRQLLTECSSFWSVSCKLSWMSNFE